jgi:HEAT repeat protein
MKRIAMSLGVLVLLAAFTTLAAGGEKYAGLTNEKYDAAVVNLMIGLKSDNLGLKQSSAFMLGELKAQEAVVPLMAILRSQEPECCRIVAALALCRIGDERGVFAVKRAVKFDESVEVAQKCAWFYEQYVQPGTYGFVIPSVAVAAH